MKTSTQRNQVHISVDLSARVQYREGVRLFLLDCKLRNLSPYTIRSYHDYLMALQHDLERWGLTLTTLRPTDLSERMIQSMRHRGFVVNTTNGRIRTCQQFFKFLFREGLIDCNLAAGLKPIPVTKPMLTTFNEQQLQAILSKPNQNTFNGQRDYAIMLVLLDTGIRVNELAALKISDLNLEEGFIQIQSSKNRRARRVPFQDKCGQALSLYLKQRGPHSFDDLWITVFRKPFTRFGVIDMISRYCKKAGIQGVKGSSHTFRHTMAKLFLLNGGNVDTLQYILGHSSLEMTRYYVDLFPADLHHQHQRYSPIERLTATYEEVHQSW